MGPFAKRGRGGERSREKRQGTELALRIPKRGACPITVRRTIVGTLGQQQERIMEILEGGKKGRGARGYCRKVNRVTWRQT